MTLIINAFQSRVEGTREDLRFSSSPQPATAQRFSAGLFWYASDGELAHRTMHAETARTTVRSWAVARLQGSLPRDAASAAPRNLVRPHIDFSPNSRTSAPLWTYRTPHLVRQGLISGNGAPQPPTQRTEAASRCGCLTKSVIVDFFQGHLDRSRGHFFCIDRRKLFDFDLLL